jgi:hypothetical protein
MWWRGLLLLLPLARLCFVVSVPLWELGGVVLAVVVYRLRSGIWDWVVAGFGGFGCEMVCRRG